MTDPIRDALSELAFEMMQQISERSEELITKVDDDTYAVEFNSRAQVSNFKRVLKDHQTVLDRKIEYTRISDMTIFVKLAKAGGEGPFFGHWGAEASKGGNELAMLVMVMDFAGTYREDHNAPEMSAEEREWLDLHTREGGDFHGVDIIYAAYETGGYSGDAFILFEKDGQLFEVNASHCSCYGLEGQWSPEPTTMDALSVREFSEYSDPVSILKLTKAYNIWAQKKGLM